MSAEQENAQWAEPGSGPPPLNAFKVKMEEEVLEVLLEVLRQAAHCPRMRTLCRHWVARHPPVFETFDDHDGHTVGAALAVRAGLAP